MRIDKFTQKMQEAVQASQDVASEFNQQEITNEHFLLALLAQAEGITRPLLEKMGVPTESLKEQLRSALQKLPRITGGNVDQRIGNDLRSVLDGAEKEMAKLKDEFVSAEHYLLALTNANVPAARALKDLGVTRDKLMQALQQVRGSQRVTDQNPEGKYQTLEKYGRDLTELARQGKIDPVIGRDNEIRRVMQVLSRRTKNNPVLIGEPGVGKTAIVEGLARRIISRRRAGVAEEQEAHRDGHRLDDRGREISRRIRGPAEGVPEGSDRFGGPDHPVHRRAAHDRRRGRGRRRGGRVEHAQAAAGARRAAHDRRDDAERVSQIHREGRGAGAALPAGDGG